MDDCKGAVWTEQLYKLQVVNLTLGPEVNGLASERFAASTMT